MTIIQQPEAYNFAGNVPNFIIDSSVDLPFRLLKGAEVLLDETYTPSPNDRIEIELYDFFEQYLSIDIPFNFTLDVYDQVDGVAEFTAEIGDGSSPDQVVFTVVKGGVDNLDDDTVFMQENFLTWQEPVKRVRMEDTEWLTYFSDQAVDVMVRSTAVDDTDETITLMSLAADKLSCINVTPSILAESLTKVPVKLELWIEASEVILNSIQTYILHEDRDKFEDRFLFENSVGGVDTIIFTGVAFTSEDNEFDKALIGRDTIEYLASNNLSIKKNTGDFRSDRHLLWARDFFLSKNKYHYLGIEIIKVIFSESDISRVKNSLNSYEFTFKHTRQSVYQRVPILSFDFVIKPPENLIISNITTNSMQLDWDSEESSFAIWISTDGVNFSQLDTVFGSTSYISTMLNYAQQYWFYVIAMGDHSSDKSNVVQEFTLINPTIFGNNLHAWFTSDEVVLDGQRVFQLTDLSGNNRHLNQITPESQPFLNSNSPVINGSIDGNSGIYWFRSIGDKSYLTDNGNWPGLSIEAYFVVIIMFRNLSGNDLVPVFSRNGLGDDNNSNSLHHAFWHGSTSFRERWKFENQTSQFTVLINSPEFICKMATFRESNHKIWKSGVEESILNGFTGSISESFDSLILGGSFPDFSGVPYGDVFFEALWVRGNPEDYPTLVNDLHVKYLSPKYPSLLIQNPSL